MPEHVYISSSVSWKDRPDGQTGSSCCQGNRLRSVGEIVRFIHDICRNSELFTVDWSKRNISDRQHGNISVGKSGIRNYTPPQAHTRLHTRSQYNTHAHTPNQTRTCTQVFEKNGSHSSNRTSMKLDVAQYSSQTTGNYITPLGLPIGQLSSEETS
ncbi:hypothetical protein QQF64_025624 [Cirrhinus molitorella]|uniref:Uncharacterized protein n=1 Tax=Cirrhinus molitorella TaxID=172907 RepID=A0ABR3NPJ8_9TELE